MIYTVTLNPSIDYYIMVDDIVLGDINRFSDYSVIAAGKGINCSKILDLYGITSTAVYFSGNSTGAYIERNLKQYENIISCPVFNEEPTRINVKVTGRNETAFNAVGPSISEKAQKELLDKIACFTEDDYVIISGSLPKNIDKGYVKEICRRAERTHTKVILDVPNFKAEDLAEMNLYLIKPNIDEFRFIFGNDAINETNFKDYIGSLHNMGVRNVLLSLGKDGAYYDGELGRYEIKTPQVKVFTTVGAGDSMLATFVGLLSQGRDIKEALLSAGGTATAMVMTDDLPTMEQISKVISETKLIENN